MPPTTVKPPAVAPIPTRHTLARLTPGLAAALVAAVLSVVANTVVPIISPLLFAIIAGVAWRNLIGRPASWGAGIAYSGRTLLRAGIVLLGLNVSLTEVAALGPATLILVVTAVGVTFIATTLIGRRMGLGTSQTLLIASGFSICGAAAVAGAEGVVDADDDEIATAIALVVVFGTLMIPILPALAALLGLSSTAAGLWIGSSTHEVAQVVAAAGLVGGQALSVAVTVKLARVLMLAPVMAALALVRRRSLAREAALQATGPTTPVEGTPHPRLPPIVPLFVVGFIAAMVLRTTGVVPAEVLGWLGKVQGLLLAAAMFALGLGVDIRGMMKVGGRPVWLATAATAIIGTIGLAGALLIG